MNVLVMDMHNIPYKPESIRYRKILIRKTMKLLNGETSLCVTGCVYVVKSNFTNLLSWYNDFFNLKKSRGDSKCLMTIELDKTIFHIN